MFQMIPGKAIWFDRYTDIDAAAVIRRYVRIALIQSRQLPKKSLGVTLSFFVAAYTETDRANEVRAAGAIERNIQVSRLNPRHLDAPEKVITSQTQEHVRLVKKA